MEELAYPIGIQTFSKIIEGGFYYVDKTAFVGELVKNDGCYFLSRPRRFGKSLLLSTLEAYFEGRRELFKGLALDSMNLDWAPTPVIHFDFNAEDYNDPKGLPFKLNSLLNYYEDIYGHGRDEETLSERFLNLITRIYKKTGRKVAILIDEYDKPLIDLEEDSELFKKNQSILKGFLGALKSQDRYIRFAMLTGVARFNKVSIFSDLNNLNDISMAKKYADICGWTQEELESNFRPGIEALAKGYNLSYEATLEKMKDFYDGYLFAKGGHRLYNPFSVLNALYQERLSYFWFHTGTPTFLVRRIKKTGMLLSSLNDCKAYESQLLSVGLHDRNPIPLLFQTGYLTIKEVEGEIITLEFPNKEVEVGFARNLQPYYLPPMNDLSGRFSVLEFQRELNEGYPDKFMMRIEAMIKDIPYEQHDERLYQNLVYLLFTLVGADARAEEHTNLGRPDIVVRTKDFIYVFEFKYNGSPEQAMEQIHERDYAGRHTADGRQVFLIGANFSNDPGVRGLSGYIIEKV